MTISIKNLSKSFGVKNICRNFSYEFLSGIYCLKGKNGSGKSTFLRLLAGLDGQYEGLITYPGRLESKINEFCTFLFDTPNTYPFITGFEFIEFVGRIRGITMDKYIERYKEGFNLSECLGLSFKEMSLGQKKKIFATANLIDECPLWVLDEPTSALDQKAISLLRTTIQKHSQSGLVIMAEHHEEFVQSLGAKMIQLGDTR